MAQFVWSVEDTTCEYMLTNWCVLGVVPSLQQVAEKFFVCIFYEARNIGATSTVVKEVKQKGYFWWSYMVHHSLYVKTEIYVFVTNVS